MPTISMCVTCIKVKNVIFSIQLKNTAMECQEPAQHLSSYACQANN